MDDKERRVHAAADSLLLKGQMATAKAVRVEIGGGSYRDINKALQDWRAQRAAAVAEKVAVPPQIGEVFARASELVWRECDLLARQDIEVIRASADKKVRECGEANDVLLSDMSSVEAEKDEAVKSFKQVQQQLADALADSRSARDDRDRLRAQCDAAQKDATEVRVQLEKARTTLGLLQKLTDEVGASNKQLSSDLARAQNEASELRGRLSGIGR